MLLVFVKRRKNKSFKVGAKICNKLMESVVSNEKESGTVHKGRPL